MKSLKAFSATLAEILLVAPAALYERQRILVRDGVLESVAGRGPGSGVRLTADAVATVVISLMASETVAEASGVTSTFVGLRPDKGDKSAPAITLGEALANIIASATSDQIGDFIVERSSKRAIIMNAANSIGKNYRCSQSHLPIYGLYTRVTLPKTTLRKLSKQFQRAMSLNAD